MKAYGLPIVCILLASAVQGNIPGAITILGAKPDLVLVVLMAYSLAGEPIYGAMLGFLAGLVEGSAVGLSLGSFIVTRTLTGFSAGLISTRMFGDNPVVPTLAAAGLTLACESVFLLANPRIPGAFVVRTLIGECIYNAILALVLYWILRSMDSRRKFKLVNARI